MIKINIRAWIVIQSDLFHSIRVGEFLERVAFFSQQKWIDGDDTYGMSLVTATRRIANDEASKQTHKQIDDDKTKTLYI